MALIKRNLSKNTVIIDKGILVSGISDGVSAARLGTEPTGNGRRQSFDHKVYTRMTNTFFTEGTDEVDDMIRSVKDVVSYLRSISPVWRDLENGKQNFVIQN